MTQNASRRRWLFLLVVAFALVAADQVTKFLAVKHLTVAFENDGAVTLPQQLRAFVKLEKLTAQALGPQELAPVVSGFWSHRYAENPGAAWSAFATMSDDVRVPFFYVVSGIAVVLIGFYFHRIQPEQRLLKVALSFVMGGALGNLVDRVIHGYVIDFLDWHVNDHFWMNPRLHWPTFNVADVGISVGVALIALDTLIDWWRSRKSAPQTARASSHS